jgi:putative ABC transport system permease protein
MTWRDLRAQRWRTLAHIGIIAVSVAAYTGIRSSAGAFAEALDQRHRSAIGADLSIENWAGPQTEQWALLDRLRAAGGMWTLVTSTIFQAASEAVPDPAYATIKAVDPGSYPLYGEIGMDPRQSLPRALEGDSIVASSELLRELGLHQGDVMRVNGLPCRISAAITVEPDRHYGNFPSALRAIVSRDTLEKTGLLRSGVPTLQRVLVRFPKGAAGSLARREIEGAFPDVNMFSPAESNPTGETIADAGENFLDLVGWFAFTLGAAGVLLMTRLHAESRLDTLAMLKCLGARPRHIQVWLVAEVLLMGGAGGFLGGLAGEVARWFLCGLAKIPALPASTSVGLIAEGTIAGLAVALIPGMAVALSAGEVRPAEVLRRNAAPASPWRWRIAFLCAWITLGLASGAAAGVARIAAIVVWALGSLLLVLYYSARGVFALLARWTRVRSALPGAAFRQGMRDLCRPGSSSPATLAVLGLIAALVVGAAAGEQIVGREILANSPWPGANVYILGFEDSELDGVLAILNRHRGIARPYSIATLTWMRIAGGGGAGPSPIAPSMIAACSASQPAGSGVILDASLARRLGVHVGSWLGFEQGDRRIQAAVAEFRNLPPVERVWFSLTFPCPSFEGLKVFHHAGLQVSQEEVDGLLRDLRRGFPALDLNTSSDMLETVHDLAWNATALTRFIAFAAAAGGAVVALALIASSAARRAREIAILKMLGARPVWLIRMLGWEFAGLGALAGLLGGGFGIVLINSVLSAIFYKALLNPHMIILALSTVGGAVIGELAGIVACSHLLFEQPLATLRSD